MLIYTRSEGAKFLRVNTRTLDKRIKAGEIRAKRIGSRVVITETALLDYLNEKPRKQQKAPVPAGPLGLVAASFI